MALQPSPGSPAIVGLELVDPGYPEVAARDRWIRRIVTHGVAAGFELIHAGTGRAALGGVPTIQDVLAPTPKCALMYRMTTAEIVGGPVAARPEGRVGVRHFLEWDPRGTATREWPRVMAELGNRTLDGPIDAWGVGLEDPRPTSALTDALTEGRPAWVRLPFNLLSDASTRETLERLGRGGYSVVAADPFDGGRLDGSLLRTPLLDRTTPTRPMDLEETRRRFAPVLALGFLTEGGGRTLAAAALQYLLRRPPVSAVLAPVRTPEDIDALVVGLRSPPFSDSERARIEAGTDP